MIKCYNKRDILQLYSYEEIDKYGKDNLKIIAGIYDGFVFEDVTFTYEKEGVIRVHNVGRNYANYSGDKFLTKTDYIAINKIESYLGVWSEKEKEMYLIEIK